MTRTPFAVALLAAAALATAAPVPKQLKATLSFHFPVGTKWEYVRYGKNEDVVAEEVVEVEEKNGATVYKLDVTYPSGKKEYKSYRMADDELSLVHDRTTVEYDPPLLLARTGMQAGDKWKVKGIFKMPVQQATREFEIDGTKTVGKPEQIVTAGGRFDAIPVTHKAGGRVESVSWYDDGVGLVQLTHSGQKEPVLELKSFTPGKDKK